MEKLQVDILGLGESIGLFIPSGNITFGVNDIYRIFPVDFLVVIDAPNRFTPERLEVIKWSTPNSFISHRHEYRGRNDYMKIDLWERTGLPIDLDGDKINVSVFSPFVATIVAYKMFEPEVINLYGVDMTNHPHLSAKAEKIRSDWFPLKKALNERGVEVNVFGNGILA